MTVVQPFERARQVNVEVEVGVVVLVADPCQVCQ